MNVLLSAHRARVRVKPPATPARNALIKRHCRVLCCCCCCCCALHCVVGERVCVDVRSPALAFGARAGRVRPGRSSTRDNLYVFCVPSSQLCTNTRCSRTQSAGFTHVLQFGNSRRCRRRRTYIRARALAHIAYGRPHIGDDKRGENDGQFRVIQFAY